MSSPWLLSLLSSFLLFIAFRSEGYGLTAWFSLIPLIHLIEKQKSLKKVLGWSFFSGLILYFFVAFWLAQVTWVGYILLCIILSLYYALFGLGYKIFREKSRWLGVLILPAYWTFLEYVRGLGPLGFPWFSLGYTQHMHLPLIQITSFGGIQAVSFLIVWVNMAIYVLFLSKEIKNIFLKIALGLVTIVFLRGAISYGRERLKQSPEWLEENPRLKVSLIQGNIPQNEKWDEFYATAILRKYEKLTRQASEQKPDLIVWPESSAPSNLKTDKILKKRIKNLAIQTQSYLMVGGNDDRLDTDGVVTNSAFLISPEGKLVGQYDKIHLVPFGEYVPLRKWIPLVANFTLGEIDFTPGGEYKIFGIEESKFSVMICFEDILQQHVRQFVKVGAQLMVNMTNDAWYGRSKAAEEHLNLARFTALANGVPMLRATNTGISAFISPYGEVLKELECNGENLEIDGFIDFEMPFKSVETFYKKYGDIFSLFCGAVVLLFLIIGDIKLIWANSLRRKYD